MESYHILSLCLLAIMATGAQAACDTDEIMGCVNNLMGVIQGMSAGSTPTEDDLRKVCTAVEDATSCLTDKVSGCPQEVQDQFNQQLAAQKAQFESTCKNYREGNGSSNGGSGSSSDGSNGASAVSTTGGMLASALLLARLL